MTTKSRNRTAEEPARFQVGDRIKLWWGNGWVDGIILEDRGPLGGDGKRMYRVTITMTATDPMTFETREEWLAPADSSASSES